MIRYRSNFKIISLYIKDTVCDFSNPTDILTVQIMGAFSQFKNTVCKERSSLGKLQKIREGFWLGIEPPYRFALSSHSKGNKLVIVTAEAKWVKQIYLIEIF